VSRSLATACSREPEDDHKGPRTATPLGQYPRVVYVFYGHASSVRAGVERKYGSIT